MVPAMIFEGRRLNCWAERTDDDDLQIKKQTQRNKMCLYHKASYNIYTKLGTYFQLPSSLSLCVLFYLLFYYYAMLPRLFCIVYFWPQTVDLIQEPHTHAYNNFLFNEQFTVIKIHLGYSIKRVRVWARIIRVAARIYLSILLP